MSRERTVSWSDDIGDIGPCEVEAEVEVVAWEDVDHRTTVHSITIKQGPYEFDERDLSLSERERQRLIVRACEEARAS